MRCQPELFYKNFIESENNQQEALKQQSRLVESAVQLDTQHRQKLTEMSDVALFIHCAFAGVYDCSEYLDQKTQILEQMVEGKISDKTALLNLVLRKELPRNDAFASLYEQAKRNQGDLQLLIGAEVIHCHEIVMKNNSYLKEAFRENKKENYEQFGKNLTR